MRLVRTRLIAAVVLAAMVVAPAAAQATGAPEVATASPGSTSTGIYAPLNRPGPPLDIPTDQLAAALMCTAGVTHARRDPILLVPGTELDPDLNFSWNYERAFARMGWPYCAITLPGHTTGDIQKAGEYIVYALRTMHRLTGHAGRHVDILGYSQGGMLPRWALRFWPDTRRMVDAFVSLDPSNHGTLVADVGCPLGCSAADWQQHRSAHFIQALNSGAETFAGISYTVIYSRSDEVVVPNFDSSGSSSLHTGAGRIADIAVQDVCPTDISEHFAMGSYDPVGYALAVDAFTHDGPADPARIALTTCAAVFQPGVDPGTFLTQYVLYLNGSGTSASITAEPPLATYVYDAAPQ